MKNKKKDLNKKFWENPKGKKITNTSKEELTYNGEKIPMVRFVDNKIHETFELFRFKKCSYNRDEVQGGFKTLLESVLNNGWILPFVIVNKNMEVLYGQHTLDVAREINGSVYYGISEDQSPSQLVSKETGRRWGDKSALTTYASDPKNVVAQRVLKFYNEISVSLSSKKYNGKYRKITIPQLLAVLYRNHKYVYGLRANGGISILGNLSPWGTKDGNSIKIIEILGYAQKNCMPAGIKRYPVITGLLQFIFDNEDSLDFNRLMGKLQYYEFNSGSHDEYYQQLNSLYN